MATAFPSGRSSLEIKLADTEMAVDAGADEIDMVIDRGAFLAGRYGMVFEQIVAVKAACGSARLKVILETGELATYDNVRRASWLALLAGGDFIKTSTGKVSPAATLPVTHVMLQAVKDWKAATGEQRAVKPAGGIRTAKDAIRYLVAVHEVAGPEWLDPYYFRFGASSVLNDLIMQRRAQLDGHYSGADYVRWTEHDYGCSSEWTYAPGARVERHRGDQGPLPAYIDGTFVEGGGDDLDTINPGTGEKLSTVSTVNAADIDRAVAAARRAYDKVWSTDAGRRAGQVPVPDRPRHRRTGPRAGRGRDPGQRQADQGDPRLRRPDRGAALLLPRRLGRQAAAPGARAEPRRRSGWPGR